MKGLSNCNVDLTFEFRGIYFDIFMNILLFFDNKTVWLKTKSQNLST